MREIKFRAWNNIDKTMIDWATIKCFSALLSSLMGGGLKHHHLMQYTGLKDKNGVEIYDGDILSSDLFRDTVPVKFHKYQGRWFANNDEVYILWGHKFKQAKVIGNIHENPELL